MFGRLTLYLCAWTSATALTLLPSVAESNTEVPGNIRFLASNGDPLPEDCRIKPESLTFFVIHGFRDTGGSIPSLEQARAIECRFPEANVVIVDWSGVVQTAEQPNAQANGNNWLSFGAAWGVCGQYLRAVERTPRVGFGIAQWVKRKGISPSKIVISGHSLGAHIAAFASNACALPEMCGESVLAIIGADPAGPGFQKVGGLHHRYTRAA